MSIRRKGRCRIIVEDRRYTWYVAPDDDSPLLMLQIVSEDKYLILTCPLRTDPEMHRHTGHPDWFPPA